MDDKNALQDIKNCILYYDYPLASSMSDHELGDIFKDSNRRFLVYWLLKLVDKYDISEDVQNVNRLGQILFECGFCAKEEILPFMDGTLNISEQFKIIQRIFSFIKIIKKPVTDKNISPVSIEEMENLSKDVNLFPMFGDIQISIPKNERNKPGIDTLNKSIDFSIKNNTFKVNEDTELDLLSIKNVAELHQKQNVSNNSFIMDQEMIKDLNECKENIQLITQFIEDINTIEECIKYPEDILENDKEISTTSELLKGICEEICNVIRLESN